MIDIENIVFETVTRALETAFPSRGITVTSEYNEIPASFPCVCIVEDDNSTYVPSQDENLQERHANIMYSVNVYSDKKDTRKSDAKSIMDVVDTAMQNMKFTRIFRSQLPNADRTIYRITARYTAVVEAPHTEGTNTVYQMYRR